MPCATPILPSGPLGHVPELTGHVAEIAGHHPETAGHVRPKYAIHRAIRQPIDEQDGRLQRRSMSVTKSRPRVNKARNGF